MEPSHVPLSHTPELNAGALAGLVFPTRALAASTAFLERARAVRQQHQDLYSLPVHEQIDGTRSFHNATRYVRHGINLLFLKGNSFEMAYQHGRLLKDQIETGAIYQASRLVHNAVNNAVGQYPVLPGLVAGHLHRQWTDKMVSHSLMPPRLEWFRAAIDEAVGISEATGLPVKSLVRALFNPEAMILLAAKATPMMKHVVSAAVPTTSCSCFAAWGSSTHDGSLILGRNMDFPLNGFYDRYPTVIYFNPTDGGQKYMTFASAGVHNAGLTAYNESGIFISSHMILTRNADAKGTPIFVIASEVIKRAQTFDDAMRLFSQHPPPSGWVYVVASSREGKVGTVELSNSSLSFRRPTEDLLAQTNHFHTPELSDQNMYVNRGVYEDCVGRKARMEQLVREQTGCIDVRKAAAILADQLDPFTGHTGGLGRNVGMHATMTSVVLDPSKGRFFIARGEAPVVHNDFVSFALVGHASEAEIVSGEGDVIHNQKIRARSPERSLALHCFISAKTAYEFDNDRVRAYSKLQEAVQIDPGNPYYRFQAGIFALMLGKTHQAIAHFTTLLEKTTLSGHVEALGLYYRGRSYAVLAKSTEALRDFQAVTRTDGVDQKLKVAAHKAASRVLSIGSDPISASALRLMMQHSDLIDY